jgi:hypothetical protein
MLRSESRFPPPLANILNSKWSIEQSRQGDGCPEDLTATLAAGTIDH